MDTASQIAQAKEAAEHASKDLLNTFSFVPDDKLGWSPSETSRSPLWLVGHCGQANHAFAAGIRGGVMTTSQDPGEFAETIRNAGRDTATREEAIRLIEESTAAAVAALDGLTPERIAGAVETPFGPMPMAFWMTLPGLHVQGHARQLDYLQTVWGDMDDHMAM